MKATIIIPTYNQPEWLALVLQALERQSRPPDEIVVADDGSDHRTRDLLEAYNTKGPRRILHVWQEDIGFRKGTIVNEAVRQTTGDWLLFLDGDAIPHREWVQDHLAWSHRGDVLCGRRVKLGSELTRQVDQRMVATGKLEEWLGPVFWGPWSRANKRTLLGVRLPSVAARLLHPRSRRLMGVNFSISRTAFAHVNGYDEEWPDRREDRDLELRLRRAGFRFIALIHRAVVYHLHHFERPTPISTNRRVQLEERSSRIRCRAGLVDERSDMHVRV